ncbi:hypothetical protein Taro_037184 [Colocasia esculenta]|uniref:Uncharacterized protein n=1 Tax=Colocasia esculenta TaxID=4460 RepID=A0A843WNY2_COLES|nr:hypothetical protein [Colocasia esculenta]
MVLVGLHCSWLVVVERQLDLPFVTARLRGGTVLWFSVIPHGSKYMYPSKELADIGMVYTGVVQTCTTSSRIVSRLSLCSLGVCPSFLFCLLSDLLLLLSSAATPLHDCSFFFMMLCFSSP